MHGVAVTDKSLANKTDRPPGWNLTKIPGDSWPVVYQHRQQAAVETLSKHFDLELVNPRTTLKMFSPLSELWSAFDSKNGDHYYLQVLPVAPNRKNQADGIRAQIRELEAQLLRLEELEFSGVSVNVEVTKNVQ